MISHGRLEKRVRLTNFVLFRRSPSSPPAQPPKGVRSRADDGDRTRDPQLGKLMLYQLSYVRVALDSSRVRNCDFRAGEGAGTLGGCAVRPSFSPSSSPAALPPATSGARSRSPRLTA